MIRFILTRKMKKYIRKSTKVYTAFFLLESNILNFCVKITTADLRKIGLKNEGMTSQRT